MILRIWHAEATVEGVARYRAHFEGNVLPELRGTGGFQRAYLLTREHEEGVEIAVHTVWESLDAIRAFAHPNVEAAVVEDEAKAALISFDETVTHYATQEYGS